MSRYLSKDESTAIKGLLIFIIILGHNAILTNSVGCIQPYLYLFHVKIFFILPFFYRTQTISFKDCVKKNFIRLYYPFLLFFFLLSILYYFMNSTIVDPNKIANGLDNIQNKTLLYYIITVITGNSYLIDHFTGYQFLWFLPVIFALMIVKNYIQDKKALKTASIIVGLFLYVILYTMKTDQATQLLRFNVMLFSPFAILQGIAMFFLGYTCSTIILCDKFSKNITRTFSFVFIILSVFLLYKLNQDPQFIKTFKYAPVIKFVIPYLFMGLLYIIKRPLSKISVLLKLGELSLPIYIFSTLICTIFYLIFNRLNAITPLYGIIAQILITVISYYLALSIQRIPLIRKKLFPRNKEELYK